MTATLPGSRSLWVHTTAAPDRAGAELPAAVDVAVLGAGIAGITAAYLLAQRGRSVLVIEARRVAAGTSGHTTAKLTAQHGVIYHQLTRQKGRRAAGLYGAVQTAALEWVVAWSRELGIDCELVRLPSLVYTTEPGQREKLRREAAAAADVGLPSTFVDDAGLPFETAGAVRFDHQAQFHPRRWLLGLAERFEAAGGTIVERVRATGVDGGDPSVVHTTRGDVRARDVVVATHYPVLDRGLFFARLDPVRDLVLSGPGPAPGGTFLDAGTHHSVRAATDTDGTPLLVVGGEPYRVGDRVDVLARFERLAGWARDRLGLAELRYRWSAHDLSTVDRLPYVGSYHPAAKRLWVATGFGQWGMTGGTAAGTLLADLITGEENAAAALFDPNRLPLRSAPSLIKDNATVARFMASGHARAARGSVRLQALARGEAAVTRCGTAMVAAHRTDDGELHAVSARCTHLGCLVAFNNAERSWDCPCHGSRYALDGSVIQGPAVRPLRRIEVSDEDELQDVRQGDSKDHPNGEN